MNEDSSTHIEELEKKIDTLGAQMDWLCENMQSFFQFIQQMGQSGGGIRGLMGMLKNGGGPTTTNMPIEDTNKVEVKTDAE